jgi:hypothetical protein
VSDSHSPGPAAVVLLAALVVAVAPATVLATPPSSGVDDGIPAGAVDAQSDGPGNAAVQDPTPPPSATESGTRSRLVPSATQDTTYSFEQWLTQRWNVSQADGRIGRSQRWATTGDYALVLRGPDGTGTNELVTGSEDVINTTTDFDISFDVRRQGTSDNHRFQFVLTDGTDTITVQVFDLQETMRIGGTAVATDNTTDEAVSLGTDEWHRLRVTAEDRSGTDTVVVYVNGTEAVAGELTSDLDESATRARFSQTDWADGVHRTYLIDDFVGLDGRDRSDDPVSADVVKHLSFESNLADWDEPREHFLVANETAADGDFSLHMQAECYKCENRLTTVDTGYVPTVSNINTTFELRGDVEGSNVLWHFRVTDGTDYMEVQWFDGQLSLNGPMVADDATSYEFNDRFEQLRLQVETVDGNEEAVVTAEGQELLRADVTDTSWSDSANTHIQLRQRDYMIGPTARDIWVDDIRVYDD